MDRTSVDTSSSGIGDLSLDGLDISSTDPGDTSATSSCTTDTADNSVAAVSIAKTDGIAKTCSMPKAESVELETPSGLDLHSHQVQQKEIPIAQLLQRTGYSIVQANGQRHYGPPPNWQGPAPQRGCEVFVGKIPRDCFEDELVPVFENVGNIYEMRLMLDHYSGQNRGYCFVVFSSAVEAKQCVRLLNNYEIRKGRSLGICMSVDNCRLFVGGIPKKVTKDDIITEMQKVTDGVVDVIVYPSASDKSKNRGFAFVEYETHRAAAMARRKLINGRVDLWGHNIAVDWAEPELEVDAEIMAQVKVLYVRNLMLSTSEAQILELFRAYGCVERVKKIKDYAFVHFQLREEAQKAMEAMNGTMLDGAQVEVTLAKPVDKDSYLRSQKLKPTFNMPAFYIPVDQYGTIMSLYPSYISPQVSSHRFMLRNSMGACMMPPTPRVPRPPSPGIRGSMLYPMTFATSACTPQPHMLYPTNPIRTGCQIPSFYSAPSPHHAFYEPSMSMAKRLNEQQEFPISSLPAAGLHPPIAAMPAMLEVTSSGTSISSSMKASKTCAMFLEEMCQRNNWGCPMYSLHTTTNPTTSGETETLFLYKVTLVCLGLTYVPPKMSRNFAEAREMAAEYTLVQLGCPMEATTGYVTAPRGLPVQYSEAHHLPAAMCPPGFLAVNPVSTSKPVCSWTSTLSSVDHTAVAAGGSAAFYANFTEGPFPMPQPYPPEYYQPSLSF